MRVLSPPVVENLLVVSATAATPIEIDFIRSCLSIPAHLTDALDMFWRVRTYATGDIAYKLNAAYWEAVSKDCDTERAILLNALLAVRSATVVPPPCVPRSAHRLGCRPRGLSLAQRHTRRPQRQALPNGARNTQRHTRRQTALPQRTRGHAGRAVPAGAKRRDVLPQKARLVLPMPPTSPVSDADDLERILKM